MQVAEPVAGTWKAELHLGFAFQGKKTILSRKEHNGPLVVQKPLYPEGDEVCHAIVVHPPGGIAGGDELFLEVKTKKRASSLLTTPGAAKWYRSGGPLARQSLAFDVDGTLEWLPQETIVFDGARAELCSEIDLGQDAGIIGWDITCFGRTGSGERFRRGSYRFSVKLRRAGRLLWQERGAVLGDGRLLESPAGLGGHPVWGTMFVSFPAVDEKIQTRARQEQPSEGEGAVTLLPGILLARYLGDSSEAARRYFVSLWSALRPALCGRAAVEPRIWRT